MKNLLITSCLLLMSTFAFSQPSVTVTNTSTCSMKVSIFWFNADCQHYSTTTVCPVGTTVIATPSSGYSSGGAAMNDVQCTIDNLNLVHGWNYCAHGGSISDNGISCCSGLTVTASWAGDVLAPEILIY